MKFRIWDRETNQFIPEEEFDNIFFSLDFKSYAVEYGSLGLHASRANDRFVFQSCTFLKDCNDNFIYLGDILKYKDPSYNCEYTVEYIERSGAFLASGVSFKDLCLSRMQISGNIWEYV